MLWIPNNIMINDVNTAPAAHSCRYEAVFVFFYHDIVHIQNVNETHSFMIPSFDNPHIPEIVF